MTDLLRRRARQLLAIWDRLEDAKKDREPVEDRLVTLKPLIDEMKVRFERLREAVDE